MVLCPARCTSRTAGTKGKESTPPTSPFTEKAVCLTDSDQANPTGTHPAASKTSRSSTTSREAATLCTGMGTDIARSMDFGNHSRMQNSFQEAPSDQADTGLLLHGSGEESAVCRDRKAVGKASNVFLVPKKEGQWRLILNLKALNTYTIREHFKMEDIRSVKDLLNKGDYMCKLHGFERRVSVSPNQRRSPKVPPISMGRNSVSLQGPTIWVGNRTSGVHEALEACSGSPSSQRTETGGIFGRHANCRDEQGRNRECVQMDQAAFGRA